MNNLPKRLTLIVAVLLMAFLAAAPVYAISKSKGTFKGKVVLYEKGAFGLYNLVVEGKKDKVIKFKIPKKLQYIKPKKGQKVIVEYEKIVTEKRTVYMATHIELK